MFVARDRKEKPNNCQNYLCNIREKCCKLPTEFYSYDTKVKIVFVGQGAGKDEEKKKRPLVGRAGKYFRLLLSYIDTINKVESFALTNTVRFRPYDIINGRKKDRIPTKAEENNCEGILLDDIAGLKPKVIVPLGKSASCFFLSNLRNNPISGYRGKIFNVTLDNQPYKIIPIYHPSALAREKDFNKSFDKNNLSFRDRETINDIIRAFSVSRKKEE